MRQSIEDRDHYFREQRKQRSEDLMHLVEVLQVLEKGARSLNWALCTGARKKWGTGGKLEKKTVICEVRE